MEPKGSELKILTALDGLFNRCLRLGGWDIQVVVPMSKVPVATTRGDGVDLGQTVVPHVGYPPARGIGYSPTTRVFPNSHPKHLLAGNYQGNFSGAQRILMATAGLLELSKAIAAFLGVAVPVVYEAAAVSAVLRSCVLATYAEACDPATLGAASATALTSKLAAENGTSLLTQVSTFRLWRVPGIEFSGDCRADGLGHTSGMTDGRCARLICNPYGIWFIYGFDLFDTGRYWLRGREKSLGRGHRCEAAAQRDRSSPRRPA